MQQDHSTREVPLTKGYVAIVDEEDYERVCQYKWTALVSRHTVYAYRADRSTGERRTLYLHRFLLNPPEDMEVDHIDRDGLNNTRSNLRLATRRENMINRGMSPRNVSGYRGVSWAARDRRWLAQICVEGKTIHLGSFRDPAEAAKVYDEAAKEYHGLWAQLNFSSESVTTG